MKKWRNYIVLWVLAFTMHTNAQNTPQSHKTYRYQDGFKIKDIQSIAFDNEGWLWISGIALNADKNRFDDYDGIIQRFNGNSFQDIVLPESKSIRTSSTYIKKRQDNLLYVLVSTKEIPELYLLNPNTIAFTPISLPIIEETGAYDISLFPYKDHFLLFINNRKDSFIYRLNADLSISFLNKVPDNQELLVNYLIEFDDHFIINDERSGVLTFDSEGNFLSKLSPKSLKLDATLIDYKLNIQTTFTHNELSYAKFSAGNSGYYQYNPKTKHWKEVSIFNDVNSDTTIENYLINDLQDNVFKVDIDDTHIQFYRYLNALDKFDFEYRINFKNTPRIASRNFEKEVFITADGELHHIIFESPNFSLFLNDYSIRGILPLTKEEAIIGTENKGWFTINLKNKQTRPYNVTLNEEVYLPTANRSFFKDTKGYWSTYDKGIVYADELSRKLTTYIHYPIATAIEDSSSIYYGTYRYNLMKFDKESKEHIVLSNTDTLDIQAIIKKNDTIYGATGSGLLVYTKNKANVYTINDTIDDNFLLSIKHISPYGLLLGSRSGKLYQFNSKDHSFKTLYTDDLKASIATFLLDDHNHIWLNTFSGIVSFDPETQNITRYGENDGMSHYESNRYSAAKTKDGYFLVGTLKGLNYFHPDSLTKHTINAKLKLSSATYYDKNTNQIKRELSPDKLSAIKHISLPAEHRNLNLEFGLLGMFINETVNYRYRFNEEDWTSLDQKNQLNLVSLAPGNYNLEIEALDSSRQKIGEPLYLQIHAKNYIYKSLWFYLALVLLIGILGIWYILQLKKQHQLKEQFATKLINTQETERSRIAKELHDSIGQKLLLLKNTIQLEQDKTTQNISLVEETIHEVREMSHNLHPFQFEKLGLTQSLHNLIDAFQNSSPIFFSATIDDIENRIPKEKEIFIFRMLQEGISNVIKHANASACQLNVIRKEKKIVFVLKDNGQGFDINAEKNTSSSLGLRTLKERAQYINAQLSISSILTQGTTITITVSAI